jgi:hypothetical protein
MAWRFCKGNGSFPDFSARQHFCIKVWGHLIRNVVAKPPLLLEATTTIETTLVVSVNHEENIPLRDDDN